MTAVWVWLRTVLRQRWRATVVLSLFVGIAGAAARTEAAVVLRTE
jgi:hypothetical protein